MIIIGEKLNSSIPRTAKLFNAKDEKGVLALIKRQINGGANYLDINTAACEWGELDCMKWVLALVNQVGGCGVVLDSPDPQVILQAIGDVKTDDIIVNSVTLTVRYDELVPMCAQKGIGVVGMPIGDKLAEGIGERIQNAVSLAKKLLADGVCEDKIFIDIVVESLATNSDSGANCLKMVRSLKEACPGVKSLAGLSNVSFGLPERGLINRTFMSGAVMAGLDAAIMDANDESLIDAMFAANALAGKDEYSMEFIMHCRERAQ